MNGVPLQMLSIQNLSYFIGSRPLYQDASLHIGPRDKIGLIGLNGTGKSTLLRIINGEYQVDQGQITRSKESTIGFLNQDQLSYQTEDSILSVVMQAYEEAVEIQIKMEEVLKAMEIDYSEKLLKKLTKLQERFEALDGYSLQSRAEEILEGIGFTTDDLHRPLNEFSGGWRMRVMLAKLLLERPSLLLLDEPTNHLDLPSIEWVENYLNGYEGAFVVVSHDRRFLNSCITKTVEVSQQKLWPYEGNYDFYLKEKALREEIQKNAYENQQQKIKQTEKFINRFRAKASKARQVQSRIKTLEKMDLVEEVTGSMSAINFQFKFQQKPGRFLSKLEDVKKSYGDNEVIRDTTLHVERGDKIALVGANGKGKSTLLRIIDGSEPHAGKRENGYNVIKAFYAQHQIEALNIENEILDELKMAGSGRTELELRNLLGCFLFTGDDVYKKIKVLSGGEKSRVALAKTLTSEANFLLLDEPTNHLDIVSENILIQALQQFKGTFVAVSHNRYFISQIANKIWYIDNKEIKEYPGTYDEFSYWHKNQRLEKETEPSVEQSEKVEKKVKRDPGNEKPVDKSKDKKNIESKIKILESRILELEQEKESAEELLSSPEVYGDVDKLQEVNQNYKRIESALQEENKKWEEMVSKLEGEDF